MYALSLSLSLIAAAVVLLPPFLICFSFYKLTLAYIICLEMLKLKIVGDSCLNCRLVSIKLLNENCKLCFIYELSSLVRIFYDRHGNNYETHMNNIAMAI